MPEGGAQHLAFMSHQSDGGNANRDVLGPEPPTTTTRRDRVLFWRLLVLLLVLYNLNFRTIHINDSLPARYLPFSLLLHRSLYLDPWVKPFVGVPIGPSGMYFAGEFRGHWISSYPILEPLLITPLYVFPAWWLSRQSPAPDPNGSLFVLVADTMEKLSASLIAALSGGVLFLALRKIAPPLASFVVALIYGLASNTWAISSQALWRQGLTELAFAFLLWALFRLPESPRAPFWVGLALGVAAVNKHLEALLVFPFLVYFAFFSEPGGEGRTRPESPGDEPRSLRREELNTEARRHREEREDPMKVSFVSRRFPFFSVPLCLCDGSSFAITSRLLSGWARRGKTLLLFLAPVAALGGLTLAYNLHFFTKSLGSGYLVPQPFWGSVAGLLVSPSRGLLVYTPWVAFALWGAARIWKENLWGWGRPLVLGLVAVFAGQASLSEQWWGGWCFGPRYLTDLLPFLACFLIPVWPRIEAGRVLRVVFAATVVFALWVQVVGAFYYKPGIWDADPVSIDFRPQRLWDWRDNQLLRSWRAGLAPPDLMGGWMVVREGSHKQK
ncbi:MAG: hypothetical protein ACLQOO_26515 [Terriglobia bacterium]